MRTPSCLLFGLCLVSFNAGANPMQAGEWEMHIQMKMGSMAMPVATSKQCFTAQTLAEGKHLSPDTPDQKCKMHDFKTEGSEYSYRFSCNTPEGKMTGLAKGKHSKHEFETEIEMTLPKPPSPGMANNFTQNIRGKRIGDCPGSRGTSAPSTQASKAAKPVKAMPMAKPGTPATSAP